MLFTLSALPKHALDNLFQTFWTSHKPCQVRLQLQLIDEPLWEMQWSYGEQLADSVTNYEESSFVLGDIEGRLQLTRVLPTSSEPTVQDALTIFTALIRQALESLIDQWRLQTSHNQLTAMVQATPLAVYAVTLEGLIKYWNTAAEVTLQLPRNSVIGQKIEDPALEVAFTTLRKNLTRGRPLKTQRVEQVQPDGSVRTLELSAAPFSEGTELLGLVGVAREVSLSEQQLAFAEQQRSLLESVLAFANDSVLITEAEPIEFPDGPRILYANEAFTRTTGYTLEEVLGKTPRILQGPQSDRAALDRLKAALEVVLP